MTEAIIWPKILSKVLSGGGKGVVVQCSEQERQKPEAANSMGGSLGGYQTSERSSILNPEDTQGKAQVCTPRPPKTVS